MNITAIRPTAADNRRPVLKECRNYAQVIAARCTHDQTTTDELRNSETALLRDPRLSPPGVWSMHRTALHKVQAELNRRSA